MHWVWCSTFRERLFWFTTSIWPVCYWHQPAWQLGLSQGMVWAMASPVCGTWPCSSRKSPEAPETSLRDAHSLERKHAELLCKTRLMVIKARELDLSPKHTKKDNFLSWLFIEGILKTVEYVLQEKYQKLDTIYHFPIRSSRWKTL